MHKKLGLGLILLLFIACKPNTIQYQYSTAERIALDSTITSSAKLEKTIAPFKDSLLKITRRIIGHSSQTIYTGKPESYLTNFVSDLMLNDAHLYLPDSIHHGVDFAIMNVYGLRSPIAEGAVSVGDIFRVMPFENKLCLVGINGKALKELLDGFAASGGEGVSGISFGIRGEEAVNCLIQNEAIVLDKIYYGLVSDYLANGGGDMHAFSEASFRLDLPVLLRDAIIQHIEELTKNNQQIKVQLDKRVYVEK